MRLWMAMAGAVLMLAGCGHQETAAERARRERDSHSPAFAAGRAAHGVAEEAGKAAKVVGRVIERGAVQAHEGWQEGEKERKQKREK